MIFHVSTPPAPPQPASPMRALFVGAGAVGAIYGHAFFKGGGETIFLVKDKYLSPLEKAQKSVGIPITRIRGWGRWASRDLSPWKGFQLLTPSQIPFLSQKTPLWDLIVLCVASDALRTPEMKSQLQDLERLYESRHLPLPPLLCLQPGLDDRQTLADVAPRWPLLEGNIPIVSFAQGKSPDLGFTYWVPPLQKFFIETPSGPTTKTVMDRALAVWNQGGLTSSPCQAVRKKEWIPAIILTLLVAALKQEQGSFQALRKGQALPWAARAFFEAAPAVAKKQGYNWIWPHLGEGRSIPLWFSFSARILESLFRFLVWASPFVVPFDFESYMNAHFGKVGVQMDEFLKAYYDTANHFKFSKTHLGLLLQKRT